VLAAQHDAFCLSISIFSGGGYLTFWFDIHLKREYLQVKHAVQASASEVRFTSHIHPRADPALPPSTRA